MQLMLFNHSAVCEDGSSDPFLLQEWKWLLKHFDHVTVVCEKGIGELTDDTSARLRLTAPRSAVLTALLRLPFRKEAWQESIRLLSSQGLRPARFIKIWRFALRGLKMAAFAEKVKADCYYSFWMHTDAYAMACMKQKYPDIPSVVRCHAFDIDPGRNPLNPWLMKRFITDHTDRIAPISKLARAHLVACLGGSVPENKVEILSMGSSGLPLERLLPAGRFENHFIRIVSCAHVLPIKQVDLLAKALSEWKGMPVLWTHIGAGEDYEALSKLCEDILSPLENVAVDLRGEMPPEEIARLYETVPFDVFINTSKMEGVPVSIMEALRCGIPTIAPNVGGIPEMVSSEVGWLYDPQSPMKGIREALSALSGQNRVESEKMRNACSEVWKASYQSSVQLEKLFEIDKKENA